MDSKRSTIVFGNGLGMALDPEYFKLKSGLDNVWQLSTNLTPNHKQLIQSTFRTISEKDGPQSEAQLDELQVALFAVKTLKKYDDTNPNSQKGLQDMAHDTSTAFKKYIHEVGIYFHRYKEQLKEEFTGPLTTYIKDTYSHVATVNYDNLLYDAFINNAVLNGYTCLIDGYYGAFDPKNLDDRRSKKLGWFLHLHGSPLFVGNNKRIREQRDFITASDESHLVLTNIKHKPTIILESIVLTEYWLRFYTALEESSQVILFGYSGEDEHLNKLIANALQKNGKPLLIVEWNGNGSENERIIFWCNKLDLNDKKEFISIKLLPNILSFTEWGSWT